MKTKSDGLTYTGSGFERANDLRGDAAALADRLHQRSSRIIPLWRGNALIIEGDAPAAVTFTGLHARGLLQIAGDVVLLGVRGDAAYFAVDLSHHEAIDLTPVTGKGEFIDLRLMGSLLSPEDAAMLAYGRAMLLWHLSHRYCGDCGSATTLSHGGHVRQCDNAACGREHYPRMDPAVIMLVTRHGPEGGACLLGRQARWQKGMYSTLAGYVEPGETLEDAVIREVAEESAIKVDQVQYRASQPWPFPSSLMMGFRANALTVRIDTGHDELEDARWFTRSQIADFPGKGLMIPRKDSISRWLIEDWLAEG